MRPSRSLPPIALLACAACTTPPSEPVSSAATAAPSPVASAARATTTADHAPAAPPVAGVLGSFPHDPTSFTEGLVYDHGALFESTGMYGESKLRKVDLTSGRVLAQIRLTDAFFGEGLALLGGELFQLTYKEGRCFVYDAATLEKKRELTYEGEGWGLTTNGSQLVMSDGSPTITFRDPKSLAVVRRITVTGALGPVANVNELEWVKGQILANVWGTNVIVRVDPESGRIVQTIDLAYLPEPRRGATEDDVLNGIAYDEAGDRLFVTGKRWSHVFQIPRP
jgi:glutamine cyclotransferase